VRFVDKLLAGDPSATGLLRHNPFPDAPPREVRALIYLYQFSSPSELRATGSWWRRERVGELYRSHSRRPSAPRAHASPAM